VFAEFGAPEIEEEVGGAVDHLRRLEEVGRAVAHAEKAQHALHAVEVARVRLDRRHHGEGDGARGGVAFLDSDVDPELAGLAHTGELGKIKAVPGEQEQVADLRAAGAVVLREGERRRERIAHGLQLVFYRAHY